MNLKNNIFLINSIKLNKFRSKTHRSVQLFKGFKISGFAFLVKFRTSAQIAKVQSYL